ncbi:MAG: argininosuccinate lyase [Desulfomonilaceae bacterium]
MAIEKASKNKNNPSRSSGVRKGRFADGMDPLFAKFNASISFDKRLFREDIEGSVAHVRMLGAQNIIPIEEAVKIEEGLKQVLDDFENGQFEFQEDLEDVHINIEYALRRKIGDISGKLHTARSRNDQIALDLRLFLRKQSDLIKLALLDLNAVLLETAKKNIDVIMPGYTHLQRAQPVRLSHHLMAYFEMFRRDWDRFTASEKRIDEMPLGSAALAGTTFKINRDLVAGFLNFSRVTRNSMDAVSDRDFAIEFVFNCSLVMTHLSRLSEEFIIWSTSEFSFLELPDEFCSGSSIMPQKKNPDACELIRAKTGRVYGDLLALLTILKGLPLTYNKDLQEDKEPVFDAIDTASNSVKIMTGLIKGTKFNSETMLKAASASYLAATDIADDLTRKGTPFREAHARVGAIIRGESSDLDYSAPTPEQMVESRCQEGSTGKQSVIKEIKNGEEFLLQSGYTSFADG